MTPYENIKIQLLENPRSWLITGVAGFIGSNLLEALLNLNQHVVGIDNFSTGFMHNLKEVQGLVSSAQWQRFKFIEGDIRNLESCRVACDRVDYVLHQAALGSVPRSLADPITTNEVNISGFLNMLLTARDAGVKSFVFAASSSTYGDHPDLPKIEESIGKPLSPYAVTKYVNEMYADIFNKCYGFGSIGLRYFNVFGPRQNPNGDYAAVIPRWIAAMLNGDMVIINGDGSTSRDFTYIDNAVQMNILAATFINSDASNHVFNVAYGAQTSLARLYDLLQNELFLLTGNVKQVSPVYQDFRAGDVRHSRADISKAANFFGYSPTHSLEDGIKSVVKWCAQHQTR